MSSAQTDILSGFWLQVGDRVEHVKDVGIHGTVLHIDENLIAGYGVTTCLVVWDDGDGQTEDIQWTNKLLLVADEPAVEAVQQSTIKVRTKPSQSTR